MPVNIKKTDDGLIMVSWENEWFDANGLETSFCMTLEDLNELKEKLNEFFSNGAEG